MVAYDKNKLFEQAKQCIIDNPHVVFIDDVLIFLPCSKPTFYEHFKPDTNEFNDIKDLLHNNKTKLKLNLRKKWENMDNATVQMALYKLNATQEEREALSMTEVKVETKGETQTINFYLPEKPAEPEDEQLD